MRIAFIGGNGHHNLNHWLKSPEPGEEFVIAAASDGYDTPSAQAMARRFEAGEWFDTPEELFDEFQPDLVSIGAVYAHNGTVAAKALERDIQVVMDKPVAATWEQLHRLRELTNGTNRTLITEFMFRTHRHVRSARQAVVEGRIGKVVMVTAQKSYRFGDKRPAWYAKREEYGGTMLWVASHMIDAVPYCSGLEYGRVVGLQGNLSRPDYGTMEDYCMALFELSTGAGAVVHADYLRPEGAATHGDDRMRIAGSDGIVEIRDGRALLLEGTKAEQDISDLGPEREEFEFILDALRGEPSHIFSTAASLATAETLLKARDAADKREWVG